MSRLIASYLRFLLKSTNQHGVHSPFVFELVTDCFYDKAYYPAYGQLDDYRTHFLNDDSSIEVTDYGAGSRVFKSNQRPVSAIAKNAGISKKRQRLLFRLMGYLSIQNCLEFGTSLGMATAAMALGQVNARIDTVEGCAQTAQKAQQGFDAFNLDNLKLHLGSFEDFLQNQMGTKNYDLIYLDGNHDQQSTINYFEQLLDHLNNESVVVLDDINWSKGMQQAWQHIKEHPRVTVTIDTFYWGLVFFRKQQAKEHFTIRL